MASLLIVTAIILILAKNQIYKYRSLRNNKKLVIIALICFTVILGVRNGTINYGSDLNNYYRTYQRAINYSFVDFFSSSIFERGYLWLNWALSRVFKWPQFIIIFQAFFCCGITLRYIYKKSEDVLLSILGFMSLGLLQFYCTGFRQAFAISMCLLALEMSEEKKYIKCVLFMALAIILHQTAVVAIPMMVLVHVELTKLTFLLDLIVSIIISRIGPWLIELGNDAFEKNYSVGAHGNTFGGLVNILIAVFVLLVMLFMNKNDYSEYNNLGLIKNQIEREGSALEKRSLVNRNYFHILLLSVVLYAMRFQTTTMERIAFYYWPVLFILFPQVIRNGFNIKDYKFIRVLSIICLLFLVYRRFRDMEFIPYWS